MSTSAVNALLRPHFDALMEAVGRPRLFDAHTHIGSNDPDGMRQSPAELLAALPALDARAVAFPMHEPQGYRAANDLVLATAAESDGRLVAYCRVDPRADAVAEARRCLGAGARGIKLHPRAEGFALSEPVVADLVALAGECRAAVLIHAGRGIPALGRDTVALSARFPEARLILAHCAISDLAWIWREMPEHSNLFIDSSWWHPSDLTALFSLVAPGQVLWASDSPYSDPAFSAALAMRCALQAGVEPEQLRGTMGEQLDAITAGRDPGDFGTVPGPEGPLDPLLERVVAHLTGALQRTLALADLEEPLGLARLACAIGEAHPHAQVASEVLELLDGYERLVAPPGPGRVFPEALRLLVMALVLARTPDVPLPERPAAPPPIREAAE